MRKLLALALLFAPALHAAEVRVFAAASLSDALKDIAAQYEKRGGDRIVFNFGGSSTLARQIEEGAPADLFLSADEAKMDALAKRGLIDRASRVSVLSNMLAIVGDADLLRARVVAIAEPSSVPAGIYARMYLTRAGLWDRVKTKIVPTESVRGALAAVDSGNADSAIVYKTDALLAKRARIAALIPRSQAPDISYPFALTSNAESPAAAKRFLAYLTSKPALDVFRRYGFLIR